MCQLCLGPDLSIQHLKHLEALLEMHWTLLRQIDGPPSATDEMTASVTACALLELEP
jgi:hypothetical protein